MECEIIKIDRDAIIRGLQGSWKEPEYPFRLAQFKDTLVKFTEEGVVEEPEFRQFRILSHCPYDVTNIKNVKPDEFILVMPEAGTCEKLQLSSNTFTLSGYSAHTEREYSIIYEKVD